MNDRVADMLTRVRNGQSASLPSISCPASKLLEGICAVLEREGYIRNFRTEEENGKKTLIVELKYHEGLPVIKEITRISKCGRREYSQIKELKKFYNGLGMAILSTSKGVVSDFEARKLNVGGEVLCSVF